MQINIVFSNGDTQSFKTTHPFSVTQLDDCTEIITPAFRLFMYKNFLRSNCSASFDEQYDFVEDIELFYTLKNNMYVPAMPNAYISNKQYIRTPRCRLL